MEIGPIPGFRVLPPVKAPSADAQIFALFDIEATAKPGDDTWTGGGKKAAGAEEDEAGDLAPDGEIEAGSPSFDDASPSRISYYA